MSNSRDPIDEVRPVGDEPPPSRSHFFKGHRFRTGFIIGVVVVLAIALLIIQSDEDVKLEWLFFDFEWPLWPLLLLTFVAGMAAWQLLLVAYRGVRETMSERRAARRERRAARRRDRR